MPGPFQLSRTRTAALDNSRSRRGKVGGAVLLALILAFPGHAADLPDASERLREAMSACTLPGPELGPRFERLVETGWQRIEPDAADSEAFRDAAFIRQPPPEVLAETWQAERAETIVVLPEAIYRHGPARLGVFIDAIAGGPGCVLATTNSVDSDLLFTDLKEAGAVSEVGPVRIARMATTIFDTETGTWRTEATFAAADMDTAQELLGDPLTATLGVVFATQLSQDP